MEGEVNNSFEIISWRKIWIFFSFKRLNVQTLRPIPSYPSVGDNLISSILTQGVPQEDYPSSGT
jgi:hypothetical protein